MNGGVEWIHSTTSQKTFIIRASRRRWGWRDEPSRGRSASRSANPTLRARGLSWQARVCHVFAVLLFESKLVHNCSTRMGCHYGELPTSQSCPTHLNYASQAFFEIIPCKARRYPHPHSSLQPCRILYRRVQHRSFDSPSLPEHL